VGLIRLDKARESAPVVLNLIKDTGWAYTYGLVSVVAIIPVISFQVYEIWRCRKEGWHQIIFQSMGLLAVSGNGFWMISDVFYHDRYRAYVKWIFAVSLLLLGLYALFTVRKAKQEKAETPQRVMMVSQQTRGIVFMHTRMRNLHKPSPAPRVLMARHKVRQ
jgi:hypothetical protein